MKKILIIIFAFFLSAEMMAQKEELGRFDYTSVNTGYSVFSVVENSNGKNTLTLSLLDKTKGSMLSIDISNRSEFDAISQYFLDLLAKAEFYRAEAKKKFIDNYSYWIDIEAPRLLTAITDKESVVMNYSVPQITTLHLYLSKSGSRFSFYITIQDLQNPEKKNSMSVEVPLHVLTNFMKPWAKNTVRNNLPE